MGEKSRFNLHNNLIFDLHKDNNIIWKNFGKPLKLWSLQIHGNNPWWEIICINSRKYFQNVFVPFKNLYQLKLLSKNLKAFNFILVTDKMPKYFVII